MRGCAGRWHTHCERKTEDETAAKPQGVSKEEDELSVGTGASEPLTDDEESVLGEDALAKNDDLCMAGPQVTYPASKEEPSHNLVSQDNSPSQNTRSKTQTLLSAIEMSFSCPSDRQTAPCAFLMQFLAIFQ